MHFVSMNEHTRHMTFTRWLLVVGLSVLGLSAAACAANPADDVPSAVVGDPVSEAVDSADDASSEDPAAAMGEDEDDAAQEAADEGAMADEAEEDTAMVDEDEDGAAASLEPVALEGTVSFQASKVTRTHSCVFADWQGEIDPGEGTAETATLRFSVETASVYCDSETPNPERSRFEQHLVSDDFFWVETYPEATFASTSIVEGGEGDATHTVTGDLTIRDVTQTISFPATVTVTDDAVSGMAEFAVDRQQWQISYPGAPDDLIRDEVVIAVDLMGQR